MEAANQVAQVIFVLHNAQKTHLLTNQNVLNIQIIFIICVTSFIQEYLDLVNFDPNKHEPKTEPNVDSELNKPEVFVVSNDNAHVKSDNSGGPSTEDNCNGEVVPLTSVSDEKEGKPAATMTSQPHNDNQTVPEDFEMIPLAAKRKSSRDYANISV